MAFASIELLQATESMFPSEGNTVTAAANGDRVLYNKDGGELTYAGTVVLGGYEIWIGPGNQTTAPAANPALVHLAGPISSSGTVKFNEYTKHVIYSIENPTSSFTGTVALNHGGNADNVVQINVGGKETGNVLSQAEVKFEDNKNNQVLHLEGNVSVKGLSTNCANSNVTSNAANNTLTLNSSGNYSYAGVIGTGNYLKPGEGDTFSMARDGVSTSLNLVKQGAGTQTVTGAVNLGSLTVEQGSVVLGGATTIGNLSVTSGSVTLNGSSNTISGNIAITGEGSLIIGENKTIAMKTSKYASSSFGNGSTTGTIRINGGDNSATETGAKVDLAAAAGRKLELNQVKSHLAAVNSPITSDLSLVNGNWAAAEWTSIEGDSYTFTGDIVTSNNGSMGFAQSGKTVSLTFTGDLSKWSASGDQYKGLRAQAGTLNVTLSGDKTSNVANAFCQWTGATMNLTVDRNTTLTGNIVVKDLTIAQGKSVALSSNTVNVNNAVVVQDSASLTLNGADKALGDVTLNANSVLTLGSPDSHEFKLTATKITSAGPSTINANVDLTNTTDLSLDGAITLGCSLELGGGDVALEGSLLENLLEGHVDSITLFNSVEKVTLANEDFTGKVEANRVFTNQELANYYVEYTGTAVNLTNGNVPEPTTGSLSLLALAGLCARRRKH